MPCCKTVQRGLVAIVALPGPAGARPFRRVVDDDEREKESGLEPGLGRNACRPRLAGADSYWRGFYDFAAFVLFPGILLISHGQRESALRYAGPRWRCSHV